MTKQGMLSSEMDFNLRLKFWIRTSLSVSPMESDRFTFSLNTTVRYNTNRGELQHFSILALNIR